MVGGKRNLNTRHALLSSSLLVFLSAYFLRLCTLSPLVHADLIHQAAQTSRSTPGHCSSPAPAPQTAKGPTRTTAPLCCLLESGHKATRASGPQSAFLPLLVQTLLPPVAEVRAGGVYLLHLMRTSYPSPSPPRYLLHAVLLI